MFYRLNCPITTKSLLETCSADMFYACLGEHQLVLCMLENTIGDSRPHHNDTFMFIDPMPSGPLTQSTAIESSGAADELNDMTLRK